MTFRQLPVRITRAALAIALAAVGVFGASGTPACTLFLVAGGGEVVFGRNLDWPDDIPGHVMISPPGIPKTLLPWRGDWPSGEMQRPVVRWASRYASIGFTRFGREFIESGMNAAGLVVAEASFSADYPSDDGRPGASGTQWMQYLLDTRASVAEVLEHLDDLRLDGESWHYLVADRNGDCAVIEYLGGAAAVRSGPAAAICALTNTSYGQALGHLPIDRSFGGEIDISAHGDSYGRFVRVAAMARDFEPTDGVAARAYAFRMLDAVRAKDTQRSVVFDSMNGIVTWTTKDNPHPRRLAFADVDLRVGSTVRVVDIDTPPERNGAIRLRDFSPADNRDLVRRVIAGMLRDPGARRSLEARSLTGSEALRLISENPE